MNKMNLQRTRELLLAIHSVCEKGIEFDTEKALELGYSTEEIKFVERIIPIKPDPSLIKLFKTQIIFCSLDTGFNSGIVYIALARIIFIVEADGTKCTSMFEEDLDTKVAERKKVVTLLDWAISNGNKI